jgi:hypothetical protein
VDLEGEIDPNTMMVNWGIDYRLVLPSIEWSVPATEKDREITNTCSLDSILALFYILTRNGGFVKMLPEFLNKRTLLSKALFLIDKENADRARRDIYET